MAGSQRSHVTAMSPHARTRRIGLAFRKLEANRINQIAAGVTGWIPIKRFRFPLARDRFDLSSKSRTSGESASRNLYKPEATWRNTLAWDRQTQGRLPGAIPEAGETGEGGFCCTQPAR
jgi:hypothetical protein